MSDVSQYFDTNQISECVQRGEHRQLIGGMWNEIGELQLSYMRKHGLKPTHTLLDIGCGSLRGGVRFVDYLDAANYFGVEMNDSLLDAGYHIELAAAGLQYKLPKRHLLCNRDFEFERLHTRFDYALALSVFTHLPLNHIQVCLERLGPVMGADGRFFATYFEVSAENRLDEVQVHQPGGVTTFGTRDPYHYRLRDLQCVASNMGWSVEPMDDFDHPRAQKMLLFRPDPSISRLF